MSEANAVDIASVERVLNKLIGIDAPSPAIGPKTLRRVAQEIVLALNTTENPEEDLKTRTYHSVIRALDESKVALRQIADREGRTVRHQDAVAVERVASLCQTALKNLQELSEQEVQVP
jgi:hypothetical protein